MNKDIPKRLPSLPLPCSVLGKVITAMLLPVSLPLCSVPLTASRQIFKMQIWSWVFKALHVQVPKTTPASSFRQLPRLHHAVSHPTYNAASHLCTFAHAVPFAWKALFSLSTGKIICPMRLHSYFTPFINPFPNPPNTLLGPPYHFWTLLILLLSR